MNPQNNLPQDDIQQLSPAARRAYEREMQRLQQQAQQPQPQLGLQAGSESKQGIFGDLIDAFQQGIYQSIAGDAETVYQLTGSGAGLRDLATDRADLQQETMSPAMQQAMGKELFTEDENGKLRMGEGFTDPRTWAGSTANLAGQWAGVLAPGVGITAAGTRIGTRVAGKLLGKEAAKNAAPAIRATSQTVGFGTAGAASAGGMMGIQARDEVMAMPDAELDESTAFRDAYWSLADQNPDADVATLRKQAREQVAEMAATQVQSNPALITSNFALEAVGGKMLDDLLRGGMGTGSRLKNMGQQVAVQGSTGAAQGGIEQYALNQAMIETADPGRDPMEGVKANAATEGVLSGGLGGIAGGIRKGTPAQEQPAQPEESQPEIQQEPEMLGLPAPEQPLMLENQNIIYGEAPPAQPNPAAEITRQAFEEPYTEPKKSRKADQPEAEAPQAAPIAKGQRSKAWTPDNEPVEVSYAVIDLDQLKISHDEAGRVNPDYPQELQQRERENVASRVWIAKTAAQLNPERLADSPNVSDGAPIIGSDGVVESGNGRSAAIRLSYLQNAPQAKAYKAYVTKKARELGVPPEQIMQMKQPVLVRVREGETDRLQFTRKANKQQVASQNRFEQARTDAEKISSDMMRMWQPSDTDGALAASNQDFVRAFAQELGQEEAASLMRNDGRANADMGRRIEAAVFHKAYQNDALVEMQTDIEGPYKNLMRALSKAAPDFAVAREYNPELSGKIADFIGSAFEMAESARSKGLTINQLIAQGDAFSEATPAEVKALATFISVNRSKPTRLSAMFTELAAITRQQAEQGTTENLFGDQPLTPQEIINEAASRTERNNETDAGAGAQPRQPDPDGRGEADTSTQRTATVADAPEQTQPEAAEVTPEAEPDQPLLESYTQQEIEQQAQEQRQQQDDQAKAEREAAQREQADREADDFVLAGSNSQTDQAEARGQNNLFDQAAQQVDTNPTEAQKEAGNYKKGHVSFQGMDIAIENPKASIRSGIDPDGNSWQSEMAHHYGYLKRTEGADGDHVDVFIGDNPESGKVFVVDQINPDGSFDEHKVMLGFDTQKQAEAGYMANYEKGWQGLGRITETSLDDFKAWLETGDTLNPFSSELKSKNEQKNKAGDRNDREASGVQAGKRGEDNLSAEQAGDDLLTPAAIPASDAARQAKDNFTVRYEQVETGTINVASDVIKTPADAAHVFAPFRKHAQETMLAAVTDKDGKILNYIRHTKGAKDGSSVYPAELVAAIAATDGAAFVWFAHNHPSGLPEPSNADYAITDRINNVLQGTGIKAKGHIVVAPGATKAAFFEPMFRHSEAVSIKPGRRTGKVKVTERVLRMRKPSTAKIESPEAAAKVISKIESPDAIVLMDNQHHVLGSITLTASEMKRLRKDGRVNRVLKAISETNTAAVIIKTSDSEAASNVARFINHLEEVRLLDWFDGDLKSNPQISHEKGTFYKLTDQESKPTGIPREQAAAAIKDQLGKLASRVNVIDTPDQLPLAAQLALRIQGVDPANAQGIYHDGQVYAIASNLDSIQNAIDTAIHEVVGHEGLRGLLGERLDAVMDQVYQSHQGSQQMKQLREHYDHLDYRKKADQRILAEELIAHLAEQQSKPKLLQRVISAIRAALRQVFPNIRWTGPDVYALIDSARRYAERENGKRAGTANDPTLLKKRPTIAERFPDTDADQQSFLGKIGADKPSAMERAGEWLKKTFDRAALRFRQAAVDRYAALQEMDKKLLGESITDENIQSSSWVLARMATSAGSVVGTMMEMGRVYWDAKNKVIDVQEDSAGKGGLAGVLYQLGSAAEIERFMGWVAANRSKKLAAEGRENLFTPEEIEAGVRLNQGKTESNRDRADLYKKVFKEFQQYRDDVLQIAEASGIITPENRKMWKDEFYVPFYRVQQEMDAEVKGVRTGKGLTRQEAYKRLKGGSTQLNDLLQNTLMNFNHLIEASLKNVAATQAMDNAAQLGIAEQVNEAGRDTKTSTFILRDGQKTWYQINDPMVYNALIAMQDPPINFPGMGLMRKFKRVFTQAITATPQFQFSILMRDSMQAIATSKMPYNVPKNILKGAIAYGVNNKTSLTKARMMATGGSMSFGNMLGADPEAAKLNMERNMRRANLISTDNAGKVLRKSWDYWMEVTNTAENINRTAIFEHNYDQNKLKAAWEARDLIDYSQHGSSAVLRFFIDVVPFLNARIQGLDKLYRSGFKPTAKVVRSVFGGATADASDKAAAKRFSIVTAAISLATIALYLNNKDNEEYEKLEDWDKDTYWHFFVGNAHYRLHKPFEVGAIATLAERTTQQFVDEKATGKLFAERLGHMLAYTFSMDPTPQAINPMMEVWANKNKFTGRQIESMAHQRLSPSQRVNPSTTKHAQWISRGLEGTLGAAFGKDSSLVLSPVQIDHLIGGYLGQIGTSASSTADVIFRSALGETQPEKRWHEYQPFRRFYQDTTIPGYEKYGTLFYDRLTEVRRVHADIQNYQKIGELERAREMANRHRSELGQRQVMERASRQLTALRARANIVRNNHNLSPEEKRAELDRIRAMQNRLQKMVVDRLDIRT